MRLSYFAYATLLLLSINVTVPERALAQPAAPPQPSAADRDTARKLLDDGDDAFSKKDFPSALKAYAAAHAIMHVPSTGIELAKAQVALGLLVEARDTALEVTRMQQAPQEPEAFAEARKQASDLAAQLDGRIPSLEVKPKGPPASVTVEVSVDGAIIAPEAATLPRRVDPGVHKVLVRATGFTDATTEVTVHEGDKLVVPIDMVGNGAPILPVLPPKPPVDEPKKETKSQGGMSLFLPIGLATTGAGLVLGLGTGLAALSNKGCKEHHNCALAWASDAGFGVAVVGAALTTVGIVLTLKHPNDAKHAALHVDPVIGVGFLGAQGEY